MISKHAGRRAHEVCQHRRPAPLRRRFLHWTHADTRLRLPRRCSGPLVGRRPRAQLIPRSGPPGVPPFSRRGYYAPELGTVDIVCGKDAGVAFVESETDIDIARLVAGMDEDAFPLVPDIRRE